MTQTEFSSINWYRGNVVRLLNNKEYLVKGVKGHGRYLLLYSLEYDAYFVADHNIVKSRISDYEEPVEVYLEHKRKKQEEAEAKREAERQEYLRMKEERKQKNLAEQERIHQEAVARKAAAKAERQKSQEKSRGEQACVAKAIVETAVGEKVIKVEVNKTVEVEEPVREEPKKRVRQRIRISAAPKREKVEFLKKK